MSPNLSYRVLPNGTEWYWELLDSERAVIDRGVADTSFRARADAFRSAFERADSAPEIFSLESGRSEKVIVVVDENGIATFRTSVPEPE